MNIYLDIDGVLLINEKFAAPHAEVFLKRVLEKYPDSTYWLTTHRWKGVDRTQEVLAPAFSSQTLQLIKRIKPTEWGSLKRMQLILLNRFCGSMMIYILKKG